MTAGGHAGPVSPCRPRDRIPGLWQAVRPPARPEAFRAEKRGTDEGESSVPRARPEAEFRSAMLL